MTAFVYIKANCIVFFFHWFYLTCTSLLGFALWIDWNSNLEVSVEPTLVKEQMNVVWWLTIRSVPRPGWIAPWKNNHAWHNTHWHRTGLAVWFVVGRYRQVCWQGRKSSWMSWARLSRRLSRSPAPTLRCCCSHAVGLQRMPSSPPWWCSCSSTCRSSSWCGAGPDLGEWCLRKTRGVQLGGHLPGLRHIYNR